jgi:amidase
MSATEAIRRFKARTLSPVELMQAVIARAEATNRKINAFTYTYYEEALALARRAEAKYAKGARTGALEGLPVAIKDESYIAGKPTSSGSLITGDHVANRTSRDNERILKAGGIVHARTATPEFSCAGYTWSKRWGVTRNPWNTKFTPGGSSGGSGASLAAGSATLATGSDIWGSIRIPAGCSGVAGFKPPFGRNPVDPPFNLDQYCHTGPMARSVADLILMQNVVSGPHPEDIATLRPKLTLPARYPGIKGWKIAYSPDLGMFEVDREVAANTRDALDAFRAAGATVEEVDIGWKPEMLDELRKHLVHIFGAWLAELLPAHGRRMTSYARAFAQQGAKSKPRDLLAAMENVSRMYATLGPLLERYDVLVCPTNAIPAVPANFDQSKDKIAINRKFVDPMLGWMMTAPFNAMSRCPIICLPSGRARNGVPTGIQIVGRTYDDRRVFRAAMAYESVAGPWYQDPASRPPL